MRNRTSISGRHLASGRLDPFEAGVPGPLDAAAEFEANAARQCTEQCCGRATFGTRALYSNWHKLNVKRVKQDALRAGVGAAAIAAGV